MPAPVQLTHQLSCFCHIQVTVTGRHCSCQLSVVLINFGSQPYNSVGFYCCSSQIIANMNLSNSSVKMLSYLPLLSILLSWNFSSCFGSKAEFVTCGTVLKLMNTDLRLRLHSHDVKYGSGSGQQSITGVDVSDDNNSHWAVRPVMGQTCKRGEPIKCNSNIRLNHVATNKNLHSHFFSSPLSGNQEVSCYGGDDGEGDSGDHWTVVCNNDYWRRDTPVKLRHIDTGAFLAGSGRTFGRPISGQGEIVGVSSQYGAYTDWQAKEGLFVHPGDPLPHLAHAIHTEL